MKLLGIVITYYPDKDTEANISSYLEKLDTLIIWENTPLRDQSRYKITFPEGKTRIVYMGCGDNVGIGEALNKAAQYGIENHFSHLLTMDQDSSFGEGVFSQYKESIEHISDPTCMAFRIGDESQNEQEYSYATGFITSGTIHPLAVFEKVGFFRADFFIDAIDCEFSSRIKQKGYKIIRINKVQMHHRLGYPLEYSFLGKKRFTPNYSAFRTYYLSRNYFVLNKIYSKEEYEGFKWFLKSYCFWRPIAIVWAEKDKYKKLKALVLGIYHGLLGKTGRYQIK